MADDKKLFFRGSTKLSLDSKNRLTIPAKYRDEFIRRSAGRLIVTADPSVCLLVYAEPDWEPIQEKLLTLPSFNRRVRELQRLLVGHAEEVEMDAAGRILISGPLREFAKLGKSVVLTGQGNRFELWDEGKWVEQRDAAIAVTNEGLPPEMDSFSL